MQDPLKELLGLIVSRLGRKHALNGRMDASEPRVLTIAKPPLGVPNDIKPLMTLPAMGESSETPSTSEPTNILTINPASLVTEQSMREMKPRYRFPSSVEVILATSSERIDYNIPRLIMFYKRPFADGFKFLVPRLVY